MHGVTDGAAIAVMNGVQASRLGPLVMLWLLLTGSVIAAVLGADGLSVAGSSWPCSTGSGCGCEATMSGRIRPEAGPPVVVPGRVPVGVGADVEVAQAAADMIVRSRWWS